MAKHVTAKNTPKGRHITATRKQARAAKHWSPPLDIERLQKELAR